MSQDQVNSQEGFFPAQPCLECSIPGTGPLGLSAAMQLAFLPLPPTQQIMGLCLGLDSGKSFPGKSFPDRSWLPYSLSCGL